MFNRAGLTDGGADRWKAINLDSGAVRELDAAKAPADSKAPPKVADLWKFASDYEDPDPRKAGQYRHWREMRDARGRTA